MNATVMRLRQIGGSTFLRAVATLMGGNAVATAVPILAAPVLGRLYMPADYGALAQYMAPAAVLAVLASLQFQHAIIAERTDRSAGQAAWLVLLGAVVVAGSTALGIAALWHPVLSQTSAGGWFWLLPLTVAAAGMMATGSFLANRHRRYGWMARLQMGHVLVTVALSITLGVQGWGADGLLAAYFLGQLVQLGAYLWLLRDLRSTVLPWPGVARLRVLARRHWKFPAFSLPSDFASQINLQIPVFALSALGADATLGAFTRARQLVAMPVTVIANAIGQVYRVELSREYNEHGTIKLSLLKAVFFLSLFSLPFAITLFYFSEAFFTFYLGPSWKIAGEIAALLSPIFALRLIVLPISYGFYILGRQDIDLVLNSIFLFANLAAFAFATYLDPKGYIFLYMVVNVIIHVAYILVLIYLSWKRREDR